MGRSEPNGPKAAVEIGEENGSLVGLGSPNEWGVGEEPFVIGREEPGNLAPLAIEVSQELSRDVDDAQASVVVPDVHDLVLPVDPEVMRTRIR